MKNKGSFFYCIIIGVCSLNEIIITTFVLFDKKFTVALVTKDILCSESTSLLHLMSIVVVFISLTSIVFFDFASKPSNIVY